MPCPISLAAVVRWGRHHVPRLRGVSAPLHVGPLLDMVGPGSARALHGLHGGSHEVNTLDFI